MFPDTGLGADVVLCEACVATNPPGGPLWFMMAARRRLNCCRAISCCVRLLLELLLDVDAKWYDTLGIRTLFGVETTERYQLLADRT